jgi:signal transduction histidine kinase
MTSAGVTLRARAFGLLRPGRIEFVLAAGLAALVVVVEPARGISWVNVVVDLIACSLAVVAVKWPRAGGLLVAVLLLVRLLLPMEISGVLGDYAPLITVLSLGMRGSFRLRRFLTVLYVPLMWLESWNPTVPPFGFLVGLVIWMAIVGLMWVIGNSFYAVTEAQRQARAAELVLQRQVLARELHDTVARSFTRVSMIAERAKLRGQVSDDDLTTITDEAAKGVEELRWVMTLLRDPSGSLEAIAHARGSLAEALSEAGESLSQDGFQANLSVDGDLSRLSPVESNTLAAVTAEAAANMAKHGDSRQPSGIVVQIGPEVAELAFINAPKEQQVEDPSRTRLGVWGMRQRLEDLQGSIQAGLEDQRWVTRVRLPLSEKAKGEA